MNRGKRFRVSLIVGVLFFLGSVLLLFPWACDDDQVPSWDRCTTYFGTPAWSVEDLDLDEDLNKVAPLVIGAVAGVTTWFVSSRRKDDPPQR
jgi:hypothetical protein